MCEFSSNLIRDLRLLIGCFRLVVLVDRPPAHPQTRNHCQGTTRSRHVKFMVNGLIVRSQNSRQICFGCDFSYPTRTGVDK